MFFKQFANAMQGGVSSDAAAGLSNLNPHRMAFRGWSGSAQMVSWLINQDARGKLPGLKVRAGVMMAGGSHACYNWPGHGAINNCANCNASEAYRHDPNVSVRHTSGRPESRQPVFCRAERLTLPCVSTTFSGFWMFLDCLRTRGCGRRTLLRAVLPYQLHRRLLQPAPREVLDTPTDILDSDGARLWRRFLCCEALSQHDAGPWCAQRDRHRTVGPAALFQHREPQ
eukprot:COSAG02_NODE_5503_length_4277_cov_2.008617_2_plen_227_part_00